MNPFITLTRIQGKGQIRININSIVLYEQKTYSDSPRKYTYILVQGGSGCTREVEETPEEIDEMISHAVLSIPFTHIKGA
jgi:hypothetical protein